MGEDGAPRLTAPTRNAENSGDKKRFSAEAFFFFFFKDERALLSEARRAPKFRQSRRLAVSG